MKTISFHCTLIFLSKGFYGINLAMEGIYDNQEADFKKFKPNK